MADMVRKAMFEVLDDFGFRHGDIDFLGASARDTLNKSVF
jgi:hypothetical protein